MINSNFSKVIIVAELSANHNRNFSLAIKTIQAIAKANADAVKIQTFKPESLTINMNTAYFSPRKEGLWKGYTPWKLYSEAAMPYDWQPKLKKIAEEFGLLFFSSPFDKEAVDFLENIDVPFYKIASFEITDINLIEYAASKGKPIFISTGLAELEDIQLAVDACRKVGNNQVTLLKCTSQYPATPEQANLMTIPDMKTRFGVEVGVSDHTLGSIVPVVAVALGASIVEKHFILSRELGGPDAAFSMEPHEFKEMVNMVRQAENTMGDISYNISEKDRNRRRSLFIIEDIKAGEIITEKNVRSIRPGYGLHPKLYREVLGKKAKVEMARGTALKWDDLI